MLRRITDEQFGQLCRRLNDLTRRVVEGTISFKPTMEAIQSIIEGGRKPALEQHEEVRCEARNGCRCTICGGYFGDGDDVCASGHQIGVEYPALRAC